ncbi:MAG: enolase C-terminal domain-like protein [Pirellulales bacterium]
MTIDAIELFRFGASTSGESPDCILARIESSGLSGWGEAIVDAAPVDCEQWARGTFAFLEHCLAPAIVARVLDSAESLGERMNRFRGHSLAKGAIDCAWRDLTARREGKPLWQSLGGSRPNATLTQTLGPRQTIDELIARVSALVERGTTEITLKLRPGWGIDVVRAVRGSFASLGIRVDFDGTASLDQRDLLFRLQDFQVAAIEQPLDADDLVGHAMLQESLRTPVCLDQSITSPARARMAIDVGSCRQIRIRPDYCGGLTSALEIAAACRNLGVACVVGCRARSNVGLRHAAALAMLDRVVAGVEMDGVEMDGVELGDVELGGNRSPDGNAALAMPDRIDAWSEPGIGVEPDERALRTDAVASCRIETNSN